MDQPLLIVVPLLSYNTHIIFHTCVESIHRCFTILYYCVSPIMVCREIQTASSKDDELILLLMNGLPQPNRQLWYNTDELQNILKLEGLPSLPENLVANALRTNRKYDSFIEKMPYSRKNYYNFDYSGADAEFDTPLLNTPLCQKQETPGQYCRSSDLMPE